MTGRITALLALLFLVPAASAADTVAVDGAVFPARVTVDGTRLDLAGSGSATYRVVITVYAAALYAPPGTAPGRILDASTPRRLVIHYFHDIRAEQIIAAAMTVLNRQLPRDRWNALSDRIERFHGWYGAVSDGDRYTLTYRPGAGTSLSLNGRQLGTINGADFARAYFGIWLAPEPLSSRLRADLLSRLTS